MGLACQLIIHHGGYVACRRPKVRKAAYAATVDILTVHARHKCTSLANQVGDFSLGVLAGCTTCDSIPTLHLLGFLQEVR